MRTFLVKGSDAYPETLTIVREFNDSLTVRLDKSNGFGIESREEVLSKNLFESCLRTNYLTEVQTA